MAHVSKRMRAIREAIPAGKLFALNEAVNLLKQHSKVKFDETVELTINLGIDPRKSDQIVRGATVLPHGTGRTARVAVFAEGKQAEEAKAAGADIVGYKDLIETVKNGEINFDVVIATPAAMAEVGKIGQILGPRGLMPNPKVGTVTMEVAKAVKNAKSGQVQFRADKAGVVQCAVGKISFDNKKLTENIEALLIDIKKAKPASAKGVYLKKIYLSSTMGPGLAIDQSTITV